MWNMHTKVYEKTNTQVFGERETVILSKKLKIGLAFLSDIRYAKGVSISENSNLNVIVSDTHIQKE